MSRKPRSMILSEINHIMLRGIGHMDLFFANVDYIRFINTIKRFYKESDISVLAYCLMSNHVHLLIQASPHNIPLFFKKIEVSYASYFNGVYEHVGHLFQNRYISEPITDESYFLNALKYILLNPEAAGISKWQDYSWSSARCYLSLQDDNLTDTSFAYGILGGPKGVDDYVKVTGTSNDFALAEPIYGRKMLTDSNAVREFQKISGLHSPTDLQGMDKAPRNRIIRELKNKGLSIRQIERLTGLNRNVIQRLK